MPDKRKKKSILSIISIVISIITIIASALFIISVNNLGFVPKKYILAIVGVLVFLNLFFGFIGFSKRVNKLNKSFQIIICAALSAALVFVIIIIPSYKGRLERAFITIPEVSELKMNVYVLSNSSYTSISDLSDKEVGIQNAFDVDNQNEAINDINGFIKNVHGNSVLLKEYSDIYSLVDALYSGDVDAILLSEAYANIIADNDDFKSFNNDATMIYQVTTQVVNKHEATEEFLGNVTRDPFVVMIGGKDAGGDRTDVNILVVVNPRTYKIQMITIPRDAYIAIDGDYEKMDKLTHASVISNDAWIKSVETLLNVNIDFYSTVGYDSIVDVVNALGGIDINNPYAFSTVHGYHGTGYYYFEEGNIHLDGYEALAYARERESIGGDVERNKHQALVLKSLINKVTSVSILNNIDSILKSIEGMITTNLSMEQLYSLVELQLNKMPSWDIKTYGLSGEGENTYSYVMGYNSGPKWYVSHIHEADIEKANELISDTFRQ